MTLRTGPKSSSSASARAQPMRPLANAPVGGPRFRSSRGRAGLLRSLLWLSALTVAIRAGLLIAAGFILDRSLAVTAASLADLVDGAAALGVATLVAAGVTWLAWVAWTSRLEENAAALGSGDGSVGPRGAILWWLVPGFNLLVPFGQLLGLDRRLSGEQRARDALLTVWWLTLLLGAAVVIASSVPLAGASATDASSGVTYVAAGLASLVWLAALLLSLRVVNQVQSDEEQRVALVRQGWRPGAPSWPVGPTASAAARSTTPLWMLGPAGPGNPSGIASAAPARAATQADRTRPVARPAPRRAPSGIVLLILFAGLGGLMYGAFGSRQGSTPPIGVRTAPPTAAATPKPLATATPRASASAASVSPGASAVGTPSATESQPPSGSSVAYLMLHVTTGDGACGEENQATWPPNSLGAIDCRPDSDSVATLQYALYENPDVAEAAYTALLTATQVPAGSGDCFSGIQGEGSFLADTTPRGRVFCWVDPTSGLPSVTWFDRTLAIVGYAAGTGTDLGALCAWWVASSGPA